MKIRTTMKGFKIAQLSGHNPLFRLVGVLGVTQCASQRYNVIFKDTSTSIINGLEISLFCLTVDGLVSGRTADSLEAKQDPLRQGYKVPV